MAHIMRKLAVAAAAALSLSAVQADVLDFEDLALPAPFGTNNFGFPQSTYHGLFRFYDAGNSNRPAATVTDPYGGPCAVCEGSWLYSDIPLVSGDPVWSGVGNTSLYTEYYYQNAAQQLTGFYNLSYPITTTMPILWQSMELIDQIGPTGVTITFYLNGAYVGRSETKTLQDDVNNEAVPWIWSSTTSFYDASENLVSMPGGVYADKVVIVGLQGAFALDNIVYLPIPEPATYGLMSAGLLAVGAAARRRKAQ